MDTQLLENMLILNSKTELLEKVKKEVDNFAIDKVHNNFRRHEFELLQVFLRSKQQELTPFILQSEYGRTNVLVWSKETWKKDLQLNLKALLKKGFIKKTKKGIYCLNQIVKKKL